MKLLTALLLCVSILHSQSVQSVRELLIGSAFTGHRSTEVMRVIFDRAGGRLAGTPANEKAIAILTDSLRSLGFKPQLQQFSMPGYFRGEDRVEVMNPFNRVLRAAALGYVHTHEPFSAELVFAGHGHKEEFTSINAKGKVVLVTQSVPAGKEQLLRYEVIDIAAEAGAVGVLFINEKAGGLLLLGMSNFKGLPSKIPAYTITLEEGLWLKRLCDDGVKPAIRIRTLSEMRQITASNVVVTLPGKVAKKIVVGAHFDSWDISQGAIDNGQGSAILFDVARLLRESSPTNHYTVEFVWFNGEELGLWGAKAYVEQIGADNIAAMVNMDMTGRPTGFHVGGDEQYLPMLRQLAASLKGFEFRQGVVNSMWTNSDHQPFMLKGIPTFGVNGHLDQEMVRWYHDFSDTYDKMNRQYVAEASAVISILIHSLANDESYKLIRRSDEKTIELLKKYRVDVRLKRQGEYPFAD